MIKSSTTKTKPLSPKSNMFSSLVCLQFHLVDEERNEMNNQDSNLEVLSNLLHEFYGSSLEGKKSRLIKVKRILNHEKTPSKDVSIVKKRLKDFQVKLHDARKQKKEERFKAKRNYAKPSTPNVVKPTM